MDESERSRLEAALTSKMYAVLAQHDKRIYEIFAKVRERVVEINQAYGKMKFGLAEVKSSEFPHLASQPGIRPVLGGNKSLIIHRKGRFGGI